MISANVYKLIMTPDQLQKFRDREAYVDLVSEKVYNNAEEVKKERSIDVSNCDLEDLVWSYEFFNGKVLDEYHMEWGYTTYKLDDNKILVILLIEFTI